MSLDIVFIAGTPSGQNWHEVYVCPFEGCGRLFHSQFGYFQLAERRLQPQTQLRRECPRHGGEAQYLSTGIAGEESWQCLQDPPPSAASRAD